MVLLVFVTFEKEKEAEKIAEVLVKEKLAACVTIIPKAKSFYVWKRKLTKSKEAVMLVKTTRNRFPQLMMRVRELHSSDCPEVIGVNVERGLPEYIDWVRGIDSV
jgi:periplasmic divalent cation tolerance protein